MRPAEPGRSWQLLLSVCPVCSSLLELRTRGTGQKPARAIARLALSLCLMPCELGGRSQPLGKSDPHGEHFHHEQLLVQTAGASEGNARVQSQSLDAVPVEAGVLARGAPHGFVGDFVLHGVQADAAGVVLAGTWLQCLLWAVLPTEGPVRKVGEMGKGRGEGSAESFGCDGHVGAGAVREPQPPVWVLPLTVSDCWQLSLWSPPLHGHCRGKGLGDERGGSEVRLGRIYL